MAAAVGELREADGDGSSDRSTAAGCWQPGRCSTSTSECQNGYGNWPGCRRLRNAVSRRTTKSFSRSSNCDRVLAVEHEKRDVHPGEHVGRELGEIGLLERSAGLHPAPDHDRVHVALERRAVEERLAATIERRLVAGLRQRADAREIRGDLGRDALHRRQRRLRVGRRRAAKAGAAQAMRSAALRGRTVIRMTAFLFRFVGTNMRKPFCRKRADAMTNLFTDLQGSVNAKDRQCKGPLADQYKLESKNERSAEPESGGGALRPLSAGDIAGALATMTDDATWLAAGRRELLPAAGSYDKAKLARLFQAMLGRLKNGLKMTVKGAIADGDMLRSRPSHTASWRTAASTTSTTASSSSFAAGRSAPCASTSTRSTRTPCGSRRTSCSTRSRR